MTSTFPTSRTNSRNLKYGIKEIQKKKDVLKNLEAALKKRVTEFRELCLKEGELTGHLPADYPLQPREPIPQVRRRVTSASSIMPPAPPTPQPPSAAFVYEETKPFQMSDFYKYSAKFRHKPQAESAPANKQQPSAPKQTKQPTLPVKQPLLPPVTQSKSTRQLQEEAKNSMRFTACDDQILHSRRLIEKSGQKLIEATARAIAGNPSLAERLNNILPNGNNHYNHPQHISQHNHNHLSVIHNNNNNSHHHNRHQHDGERY